MAARQVQKSIGGSIGPILTKLGHVSEEKLLQVAAERAGMRAVTLKDVKVSAENLLMFEPNFLEKHEILPVSQDGRTLVLAVSDPNDVAPVDEVRFMTGLNVEAVLMSRREIQKALNEFFHRSSGESVRLKRVTTDKSQLAREIQSEGLHQFESAGASSAVAGQSARDVVNNLGASPANLSHALAALLLEKGLLTADELRNKIAELDAEG
jgi:type IV pilus assembly protein PilB